MKGGKIEAAESILRGCSSSSPTETQTSLVPEKKKKEEEKETTTATESKSEAKEEKKKKKKKSRKRRKTESGSILRGCSSSSRTETETSLMPEKKKAEETTTKSQAEEKKEKKKSRYGSLTPLITTVTSTTTITTSITIITPPENPNYHIHLYLCVYNGLDSFTWFEIDPSNTIVEPPKHSSSSISSDPHSRNNNYYSRMTRIFPISQMPSLPFDFHVIPETSPTKHKKLVYAIGGGICPSDRSSKAFVCDFASSSPTWEELPPMPSQLQILMGVANPLDDKVYAFGYMYPKVPSHPLIKMGLIFDPSSTSWNQCPHPFDGIVYPNSINDYALIDTEDKIQLCVFTSSTNCHRFNLTTAHWEYPLYGIVPKDRFPDGSVTSSSVGVGHIIFKFHNRKLYAYDSSSSPKPSFEPVLGMENEFTMCRAGAFIAYLGKGKLCIVWYTNPDPPAENAAAAAPKQTTTLYIHCLTFWVGMCNGTNRLRALMDRCETFSAHGGKLYSVVAL